MIYVLASFVFIELLLIGGLCWMVRELAGLHEDLFRRVVQDLDERGQSF